MTTWPDIINNGDASALEKRCRMEIAGFANAVGCAHITFSEEP